jgi:TusA-related sulfurtransferase
MQLQDLADTFAHTLEVRDVEGLRDLFADDAAMTALLPRGPVSYQGRDEVVGAFATWFGHRAVTDLAVSATMTVDRPTISYRAATTSPDRGPERIEQHLVLDEVDDRIRRVRLLCSGFRPATAADAAPVAFDAGTLGCGDGLARAFKERLAAIEVGASLETVARDPSAREELPALARLLGHDVCSVTDRDDGAVTVTVVRTH